MSRRLWGGGNTSPLKRTAWEAKSNLTENSILMTFKKVIVIILMTFKKVIVICKAIVS